MKTKQELRVEAKNIRKNLDIVGISGKLVSKIRNLKEYQLAQNVLIFYPLKTEVNLLELINDDKNFYLPKVQGNDLVICPYTNDIEKSDLNIFEPCSAPVNPEILDLIFLPALMADSNNYRLGYGKGYYDRFLAKYPNIKTILPIAKELIVNSLPTDNFDIKACQIVTV